MPKVPTYNIGQVQETSIQQAPTPTANASQFGYNNFNALQQLGQATAFNRLSDVIISQQNQIQNTANTAMVRNTNNQVEEAMRAYSGEQAKLQGKDSINLMDGTVKKLEDLKRQASEGLENDQQKAMFNTSFQGIEKSYLNRIQARQNANVIAFNEQTKKAEDDLLRTEALVDPSKVGIWQANKLQNIKDTYKATTTEDKAKVDEIAKAQLGMETEKLFNDYLDNKNLIAAENLLKTNAMLKDMKPALEVKLEQAKWVTEAEQWSEGGIVTGSTLDEMYNDIEEIHKGDSKKIKYMKDAVSKRFKSESVEQITKIEKIYSQNKAPTEEDLQVLKKVNPQSYNGYKRQVKKQTQIIDAKLAINATEWNKDYNIAFNQYQDLVSKIASAGYETGVRTTLMKSLKDSYESATKEGKNIQRDIKTKSKAELSKYIRDKFQGVYVDKWWFLGGDVEDKGKTLDYISSQNGKFTTWLEEEPRNSTEVAERLESAKKDIGTVIYTDQFSQKMRELNNLYKDNIPTTLSTQKIVTDTAEAVKFKKTLTPLEIGKYNKARKRGLTHEEIINQIGN